MADLDLALDDPRLAESGTGAYVSGHNLLSDWILAQVNTAMPSVEAFRKEYLRCRRYHDNHQLSREDLDALVAQGRPHNVFNSAQKFVRFITGVERTAPEALLFSAINESDQAQQKYGESVTRRYDWAIDKGSGDFERSIAFEDLIIGGMGFEDYTVSYGKDPRGLPAMARFSPLEAIFPQTDSQNLNQARWRARETLIHKDEIKARWPGDKFLINDTLQNSERQTRPEAYSPVIHIRRDIQTVPLSDSQIGEYKRDHLRVLQFEWFDDEKGYYFFDPLEEEDTWMAEKEFLLYRSRLNKLTDLKIEDWVKRASRQYKRAFLLNRSHLLGQNEDSGGGISSGEKPGIIKLKRFHLNVMTGSYDEEDKIWYGFFRVLVDPQRFANKFFNQLIEIIGRSAKGGGFLYEKGSFLANQIKDFEENFSKPGTSQEVAQGAIAGKKILPKPEGQLPTTAVTMVQFCVQMMDNVTGISPDQFQAGAANVAGVTLRQKGKSSLLLLSKEFDALSRFRIEEGRIVLDLLGTLADDRLIRVGGPIDGEVVKLSQEPFGIEYELALDDTERDPNMRKMYQEEVMKIAPILIRQNMFLPELLDYMNLPYNVKNAIKKSMIQQFQERQAAAKAGVPQGGRSAPVTPEERQAKIGETQAKTQRFMAAADRLKVQSARDQVRTIMEALVKANELKLGKEKHGLEQAHGALELFQTAMMPKDPNKPAATKRAN